MKGKKKEHISPMFHFQAGKEVKHSSGFSGKGFKFDETEAQLADERKKLQKAALGLHDSDDEDGGAVSVCVLLGIFLFVLFIRNAAFLNCLS